MGEDVVGDIRGVGGNKVTFAQRDEGVEVCRKVRDGAGGTEREGEEVVTRGGEKVEGYDGEDTCGAGEGAAL